MSTVNNPFPYFPDAGTNGYIYIGSANQDAQTNPIVAYRDAELTAPWSQPIRTVNGYAAYQGAKAGIFLGVGEFSITVKDSNGVIILNDNAAQRFLNYDDLTSATSIIVTARDEAEASAEAAALSEAAAETAQAGAEAARDAANAAVAASQDYYPGARAYVPRGLTSVAITAAGSGGTNGTYTCPLTGDNLSVDAYATVIVSGGAVTSVSVAAPGLYIGASPTAGLVDVSSITGLTGATLTPTIGYLKTSGEYWLTDTDPASAYLSLFQNQSNSAVEIDAQFDPMSAGRASDVLADVEDLRLTLGLAAPEADYLMPFVFDGNNVGGFYTDGSFRPLAFVAPAGSIDYQALASAVAGLLAPETLSGVLNAAAPESGWLMALGTEDGVVGFKDDGTIVGTFDASTFDLTTATITTPYRTTPLIASPELVVLGDSTAEGAGASSSSNAWRSLLAADLSVSVINMGIGSQSAEQIGARYGAVETTLSVSGGSIPSSGQVSVTAISPSLLFNGSSSSTRTIDGTIGGSPVRITRTTGNVYAIEQIGASASLTVANDSVFIPDAATDYRNSVLVLCAGTNDRANDPYTTVETILSIVNFNRAYFRKVLVIGPRSAGSYGGDDSDREVSGDTGFDNVQTMKSLLASALGDSFLDVPQFMIDHGLSIAGISPTAQDTQDIADGIIPESLRADILHSNDDGHIVENWIIKNTLLGRSFL